MSARTRELFALIPVALLVTAGFTAVLITNSDQLGNLSVFYGAYFLALCVATHIVIRIRLPDADPFLFPLVALLAAFGMVMLYRLDEGLARDQANWFVLGLVLFSATIIFLRDYDGPRALPLPDRARRDRPADPAPLPGPRARNDAYLAIDLGPRHLPADRAGEDLHRRLPRQLPERAPRGARRRGAASSPGWSLPPLKHLGPLLVVWGAAMVLLVFIRDLGSSVMFFGAFLALIYVATARISFVIIGLALFVLGAWFFAHTVAHIQRALRHLARPVQGPGRQRATRSPSRSSPRPTAACSARGWATRWSSCPAPTAASRTAARSCPRRTPTSSTR